VPALGSIRSDGMDEVVSRLSAAAPASVIESNLSLAPESSVSDFFSWRPRMLQ
jgi:hypothetical protein